MFLAGDEKAGLYKMWYSGGKQYETDAIGYATSWEGLAWQKYAQDPVFRNNPAHSWGHAKVTACKVIKEKEDEYLILYIGFSLWIMRRLGSQDPRMELVTGFVTSGILLYVLALNGIPVLCINPMPFMVERAEKWNGADWKGCS